MYIRLFINLLVDLFTNYCKYKELKWDGRITVLFLYLSIDFFSHVPIKMISQQ